MERATSITKFMMQTFDISAMFRRQHAAWTLFVLSAPILIYL